MDNSLIEVALGKKAADLIIRNGKLLGVQTGEIYEADIAVSGGKIASVGAVAPGAQGPQTRVIDAAGQYLSPGFIDAHIHIESSMLSYTEFSKMVVKHGTTAVATDLMEVTIVSGINGMKEILAEAQGLPVKLYYVVPSFMEDESSLQTTGSVLHAAYIEQLLDLPQAVGIAEVLFPPILQESPQSAHVLELAKQRGKTAEGHAPGLTGAALNAYATAGIRSDHESTSKDEALQKLRAGLRVLMREGSAAADLQACLQMLQENPQLDTRHCCMISDDIDALHISRMGHMDHKIRMAIRAGVSPMTAYQMATLNPAESLKIDDICGSLTPGRNADIVFLSSLEECRIERVISAGLLTVENGALTRKFPVPRYSDSLLHTVTFRQPVTPERLCIRTDADKSRARVRVIGASSTSLLTKAEETELPVRGGVVQPDPQRDILSIACVERYGKNGNIGRAFVRGFGLREGAIAISVGHDHHNISVIGSDFADMALGVNRIRELQGGLVLTNKGRVLAEIPLPICGLLSDQDGESVAAGLAEMKKILRGLGCDMPSFNVTLSFLTLIFIPDYAITDRGLFDVNRFELVDPILSVR